MVTTIGSRVAGLSRALTVAAGIDSEARKLWETWQSQRHFGARAVVGALDALGGLREGLEPVEAADLVWVHNDPALYHRLVIERRWAKKRFEEWLYRNAPAAASPMKTAADANRPGCPSARERGDGLDGHQQAARQPHICWC